MSDTQPYATEIYVDNSTTSATAEFIILGVVLILLTLLCLGGCYWWFIFRKKRPNKESPANEERVIDGEVLIADDDEFRQHIPDLKKLSSSIDIESSDSDSVSSASPLVEQNIVKATVDETRSLEASLSTSSHSASFHSPKASLQSRKNTMSSEYVPPPPVVTTTAAEIEVALEQSVEPTEKSDLINESAAGSFKTTIDEDLDLAVVTHEQPVAESLVADHHVDKSSSSGSTEEQLVPRSVVTDPHVYKSSSRSSTVHSEAPVETTIATVTTTLDQPISALPDTVKIMDYKESMKSTASSQYESIQYTTGAQHSSTAGQTTATSYSTNEQTVYNKAATTESYSHTFSSGGYTSGGYSGGNSGGYSSGGCGGGGGGYSSGGRGGGGDSD